MNISSTAWKYIRRSPYQAVAAVITLFITFLLSGFFVVMTVGSLITLKYFESKPQINIYFDDKITVGEAQGLQKILTETNKVSEAKYISKQEALEIYKQQYKSDPLLLEMVTADMLPASLEVFAKDPLYLSDLENIAKTYQGVEEIIYQKDVVETLLSWTKAIRIIGLTLGSLLIFNSLLVIITVIGMKIALRRDEIEVLKLVGASPWYIRLPLIIEGTIYGIFGAFLAWAVLVGSLIWVRGYLLSFLGVIPSISVFLGNPASFDFLIPSGIIGSLMILSGAILGSLGSLISVGRYLKTE